MKKIFVLSVLSMALWLVVSCGGKGEKTEGTAKEGTGTEGTRTPAARQEEPVEAIPGSDLSEFDKLAKGYIRPYFDVAGTQTEKTVKPGETFDVYVIAEYSSEFAMGAAEYRLVMPAGTVVTSLVNSDSITATLGRHDDDYSLTFNCTGGPRLWLTKFVCAADPSSQGGEIRTEKGADMNFLGFSMCDGQFTLVNATPGKATIKVE